MKYKIKDQFLLKNIAGENIVVARGPSALQFGGILVLNDTCAVLWKELCKYCTKELLCSKLIDFYNINEQTAIHDVDALIQKLKEYDLLDIED